MAKVGVRVTMLFEEAGLSFSEAHTWVTDVDMSQVKEPAKVLVQTRANVCGTGVTLRGVRLSKEADFRDSMVFSAKDIQGIKFPSAALFTSGAKPIATGYAREADQTKACVLLRAESGTVKRKSIFLAGVPDVVLGTDPSGPKIALFPAWEEALQNYIAQLIVDSWGFMARSPQTGELAPRRVVSVVVQPVTNRLGIVIATGGAAYTLGSDIQTRLFKRSNPAYTSLNKIWQISQVSLGSPVAGQDTYYLLGSETVPVSTITKLGVVQGVEYSPAEYTNIQPQGQTTRKRGNRQLAGPGRRTIRRSIGV